MKSYEELLEEVQKAISDILSGAQEASYNGQKVKKADLAVLVSYEKSLRGQVSRQNGGSGGGSSGGGIRVRGVTPV